jgi:hypothetical protein
MKHLQAEVQRFELSLSQNLDVGFEKNFKGFLTSQFLIEICCTTILLHARLQASCSSMRLMRQSTLLARLWRSDENFYLLYLG